MARACPGAKSPRLAASLRGTPPGSTLVMAGLLARGSGLLRTFPGRPQGAGPSGVSGLARRIQLRGQPRHCPFPGCPRSERTAFPFQAGPVVPDAAHHPPHHATSGVVVNRYLQPAGPCGAPDLSRVDPRRSDPADKGRVDPPPWRNGQPDRPARRSRPCMRPPWRRSPTLAGGMGRSSARRLPAGAPQPAICRRRSRPSPPSPLSKSHSDAGNGMTPGICPSVTLA